MTATHTVLTPVGLGSLADRVEIAPGVRMPILGLGTSRAAEGGIVEDEIAYGFDIGYRGVDTAAIYGNEAGVGAGIRRSGVAREDVFVATKVWNSDQGYGATRHACERSLGRLGLDYIDLYLIHWPQPALTRDTWRAMEELRSSGKVRAIGVCNFLVQHLEDLLSYAEVPPAVNQFECHPRLAQADLRDYCADHDIVTQAWSPLLRGGVTRVPELIEIASRHGKTVAQVTLRWVLQNGMTTIPKSVHHERIAENADIFDFELSHEEMARIDSLEGERIGARPETVARLAPVMHFWHPRR